MKFLQKIREYFEFAKHKTNFRTEILAGVSTFLALSYIFVVNPSILGEAGMNKSMVLFATIVVSFLATFLMGLWAKKPFVLAPGMEMNAYVAFFVILGLGFTWQQALGAVFWSGILFMILTLTGVRKKIIQAIPDKMKSGLALSVGVSNFQCSSPRDWTSISFNRGSDRAGLPSSTDTTLGPDSLPTGATKHLTQFARSAILVAVPSLDS